MLCCPDRWCILVPKLLCAACKLGCPSAQPAVYILFPFSAWAHWDSQTNTALPCTHRRCFAVFALSTAALHANLNG